METETLIEHKESLSSDNKGEVKRNKNIKNVFIIIAAILIFVIVGIVVLFSVTSFSGECGDKATFKLMPDGLMEIKGSGKMYDGEVVNKDGAILIYHPFYSNGEIKSIPYDQIKKVNIENGITRIGDCSFAETAVNSVSIPDTVTEIGDRAFFGCEDLKSVMLSDNVKIIGNKAFMHIVNEPITIYASEGSYAAKYASDNGYKLITTNG